MWPNGRERDLSLKRTSIIPLLSEAAAGNGSTYNLMASILIFIAVLSRVCYDSFREGLCLQTPWHLA